MLSRIFAAMCLFALIGEVRAEGLPSAMYNDPVLTVPKVVTVFSHGHPDQIPLWQEALARLAKGEVQADIARSYQVSQATISVMAANAGQLAS